VSSTILKVPEALAVGAAKCGALAGEVTAGQAPVPGPSSQPSAAAFDAGLRAMFTHVKSVAAT
jgi:hypothetical protein